MSRRVSLTRLVFAFAAVTSACSAPRFAREAAPSVDSATAASVSSPQSLTLPLQPPELATPDAGTTAAVPRPGVYANLDPDDDYVTGPPAARADCEAELARAGVSFKPASLAVHQPKHSKMTCGAPQVVVYLRGPGNVSYSSPPILTCAMALALASFERILQSEAMVTLGSPVARIDQIGTYSCREIAAYPGLVSEHSYANAIDIVRFALKDGRSVEVLRDFDVTDGAPRKPAGVFLRAISRRANDEDVFSHVLTPFFNEHHKNHFHLDLARYRNDGTR